MEYKVYDKAKWHYEADDMPKELPDIAGATHIAFFMRWCIKHNFMSREVKDDFEDELQQIKENELDCRDFFFNDMDGVFTSEELNTKGAKFASAYYDSDKTKFAKQYGFYITDYENWKDHKFGANFNYHYVENSEENYTEIGAFIDKRYAEFLNV